MKLSTKEIKEFQKKILEWYSVNQRNLPWRQDRDPYHILVSELMLQQTQVSRVIPKYREWMKVFPDVQTLAKATTRDVLLHWSGLGYNRRALYLKKVAEEIVKRRPSPQPSPYKIGRGRSRVRNLYWPKTEKELMKLPGIGKYTARAILCFAFNKQVAVVDTNVRKVILTFFKGEALSVKGKEKIASRSLAMTEKEIEEIAAMLLPKGKAYEWNQALMDYAASELKQHPSGSLGVNKIPFKDSDRYFRGQILKFLLEKHTASLNEITGYFSKTKREITKERLENILEGLIQENFILHASTYYSLQA